MEIKENDTGRKELKEETKGNGKGGTLEEKKVEQMEKQRGKGERSIKLKCK